MSEQDSTRLSEMVDRVMGLVVPLLKRVAEENDTTRNEILVAVGACEQLQFEAKSKPTPSLVGAAIAEGSVADA